MRIRKNAKLTKLKFADPLSSTYVTDSQTVIQPHICNFNQSPWDVISFPIDSASSSYQVDQDDGFLRYSNFGDSCGLDKSVPSNKMSMNGEQASAKDFMPKEDLLDLNVNEKTEHGDGAEGRKDQLGFEKEETMFCSRNDGKGWRCKKPVHKTYSLCKHHLAQHKRYQSSAYRASMKKPVERKDEIREGLKPVGRKDKIRKGLKPVGRKDKIRQNPCAMNAPSAAD